MVGEGIKSDFGWVEAQILGLFLYIYIYVPQVPHVPLERVILWKRDHIISFTLWVITKFKTLCMKSKYYLRLEWVVLGSHS